MDGLTITVTLGGRGYEFKEPGNRARRGMLQKLIAIQKAYGSATDDVSLGLAAYDAMLDFLKDVLGVTSMDSPIIDDAATEAEIPVAFAEVSKVLLAPFVRNNPKAAEALTQIGDSTVFGTPSTAETSQEPTS